MTLHPEGRSYILGALALNIAVAALLSFIELPFGIALTLGVFAMLILVLILQFFRYPNRSIVKAAKQIIAPADGKVVVIERVQDPEFLAVAGVTESIQVSIFMSPFNVHSNHNPVTGKVKYFKYHPGKFLVAWHPKSSTENERTTLIYELPDGQLVLVRQIAGALARRIRWYVKEGQQVEQGDQFGFIKFGSRVDILMPTTADVKVKLDQISTGLQTVIAHLQ